MGTLYVRVGNRTMTSQEAHRLSPAQLKQAEIDAEKAKQKRLDNIARALGQAPKSITLDVTPAAVAARKAAIAAEEAKLAAESAPADVPQTSATPAEPEVKKSKGKKATAAA